MGGGEVEGWNQEGRGPTPVPLGMGEFVTFLKIYSKRSENGQHNRIARPTPSKSCDPEIGGGGQRSNADCDFQKKNETGSVIGNNLGFVKRKKKKKRTNFWGLGRRKNLICVMILRR